MGLRRMGDQDPVVEHDAGEARFEGRPPKEIVARYDGICTACGGDIFAGGHMIRADAWGDGWEHADPRDCG